MTKLRIFTDREYRYKNRTHNKHITELTGIIKNKTNDNNNYKELMRETVNMLAKTNSFSQFIYKTYSELYTTYNNITFTLQDYKKTLFVTEQKLNEIEELYENLEELYNEKVTECEKLKNENKIN
jgi:DNA repair ATPase RecN